MKNIKLLSLVLLVLFASCSKDDSKEQFTIAVPLTMSLAEIRASVEVMDPQPMVDSGKMYLYEDYVFVNENNEGVHILKGLDQENFQKVQYIKIPGNTDVSVKNGFLYADSYTDLVVFDINDINNIELVTFLENVLPNASFELFPEGADWVDYESFDPTSEIIVGFEYRIELHDKMDDNEVFIEAAGGDASSGTGTGGSLARFKIVDEHLYVVDNSSLNVFDIGTLNAPQSVGSEYVGWQIETIFHKEDYLYLGSSSGMFIYDLENPSAPQMLSTVSHILGCDPVVVQGDYAYVTIRGGNFCGQDVSQLDVINVADKSNPFTVTSVELSEPYGLGVRNESLFVSDGAAGLKLFNIEIPDAIFMENSFSDISIFDIIPLEDKLLMVGDNTLYIYHYLDGDLELAHSFNLN